MPTERLVQPWKSFLNELDAQISTTVVMHCLGGFAISLTYGLPRPTADIDVCEISPSSTKTEVVALAGHGSPLHKKHRVYIQIVTVATLPYNHEERLKEVFSGSFRKLRLLVLEPHDMALSKVGRNSDVDLEDVKYLGHTVPLDLELLRARYLDEVRPFLTGLPERSDTNLDLWCSAIKELQAERGTNGRS